MIDNLDGAVLEGIGAGTLEQSAPGTYRTRFDRRHVPATVAVAATIADVLDVPATEVAPIHRSVDADALDELVDHGTSENDAPSVTFEHESVWVTVDGDGVITATLSGESGVEDGDDGLIEP